MRVLLAGLLGAIAVASTAQADARAAPSATVPVARYCSQTGDICYGIFRKSGAVYLDVTTFARYFARYRLCVKPPSGAATCHSFPMRRNGEFERSSVLWHRNYPGRGAGRYLVTWKLEQPLGPSLSFRLR